MPRGNKRVKASIALLCIRKSVKHMLLLWLFSLFSPPRPLNFVYLRGSTIRQWKGIKRGPGTKWKNESYFPHPQQKPPSNFERYWKSRRRWSVHTKKPYQKSGFKKRKVIESGPPSHCCRGEKKASAAFFLSREIFSKSRFPLASFLFFLKKTLTLSGAIKHFAS